jgi:hypothetical protein
MLFEGYKFAGGRIELLTRPQQLMLSHVFDLKTDIRAGKAPNKRKVQRSGQSMVGTPEEIAAQMIPKFEKIDRDGREWEIQNAKDAMERWELMQRQNSRNR